MYDSEYNINFLLSLTKTGFLLILPSFVSQSAYMVNMLIAGFDDANGPELYFMDWLASLQKVSMLLVVVTVKSWFAIMWQSQGQMWSSVELLVRCEHPWALPPYIGFKNKSFVSGMSKASMFKRWLYTDKILIMKVLVSLDVQNWFHCYFLVEFWK